MSRIARRRLVGCSRPLLLALIAVAMWVRPSLGQVQPAIEGTVVDSTTRAPLSGVLVAALDSGEATVASASSDGRGRFRLTNLVAERYTLICSRGGYVARRLEGLSPNSEARIEVALSRQRVELDVVQVTASRVPETTVMAPVSVSVVSRRQIAEESGLAPVDLLRAVTGVDFMSTGLIQSGFAVRGSNAPTQGLLLVMEDNRNVALPSLGLNTSFLLPFSGEDIERIEVVRGPGAALYGPDAHRGVIHFVTRSPFESQGWSLSFAGGERSTRQAAMRYAAALSSRVAYKISGNFFEGRDWQVPASDEALRKDRDVRSAAGEARVDWRPDTLTSIVGSVGFADAIDVLALLGAGPTQVKDWRSTYAQARLQRGALFGNLTYNLSDAGHTYRLRTGAPVVDNSRQAAGQVQHGTRAGPAALLYGVDGRWTDPRTEGTIHGVNEDDDRVTEVGGFLQGRTALSPVLDLVTVLRVDRNNRLNDLSVSPRSGIIYMPTRTHSFRLTYNRAFSSPDPSQLFRDVTTLPTIGGLPYAARNSSIPRGGYSFRRDCDGSLCMRSPLNPDGVDEYLPAEATRMWASIVTIMARKGVSLASVPPPSSSDVATVLGAYDTRAQPIRVQRVNAADVADFAPIRRTFTETLELGYRGVLADRVLAALDGYVRGVKDPFGGAFTATPSVFLDSVTLARYLATYLPAASAPKVAATIAQIPVGTVSPRETRHPVDLLVLQRQGGRYTAWGADANLTVQLDRSWEVTGSYSWVDANVISDVDVVGPIRLNVPEHKGVLSLRYHNDAKGWMAALQARGVGARGVETDTPDDPVAAYGVVDAHLGYNLSDRAGVGLSLDASNLLNHEHREVAGGGRIGRMIVSRVRLQF